MVYRGREMADEIDWRVVTSTDMLQGGRKRGARTID